MKKINKILLIGIILFGTVGCKQNEVKEENVNQNNNTNNNTVETNKEITLEDVMNAPTSPESDFECMDQGNGELILLRYLGDDEIVVIPETWNDKKITAITSYVFANNSPVKAIKLSNNIETINSGAFGLNKNLEIVVSGKGLKTIGEAAFQACSNLHTVVLNEGLETIKGVSFSGCKSLIELEIPASVKEIQPMTFYNRPDNLTIIGTKGSKAEEYANSEGIKFQTK